jgi:oligoribonuclease
MAKKASLLWMDLEMTGLDPAHDRILEVAVIGTDWDLNQVFQYEATIKVDKELIEKRMVGDFWKKNKGLKKVLVSNNETGKNITEVEKELVKLVDKNFAKKTPVYLSGNSIHQDRKFIESEMLRLNAKLHYRMLDVSAWKIVFAEKFGVKFEKPEVHRALSDIEGSIEEFKLYLEKVENAKP